MSSYDFCYLIENEGGKILYNLDEAKFVHLVLPKPLRHRVMLWSQVLDLSTKELSQSLIILPQS